MLPDRKIFISAGEVSGDIHGADLMAAIKKLDPGIEFTGLGGKDMISAGLLPIYKDLTIYNTIGIVDTIKYIIPMLMVFRLVKNFIKKNLFSTVILVDNQGFNIPLGRLAKKLGLNVFYYFPPPVSVWGRWNADILSEIVDHIICPFYEDFKIYREKTSGAWYSGHPLIDKIKEFNPDKSFLENTGLSDARRTIAILPGSRFQEVNVLFCTMLKAVKFMIDKYGYQAVVPVSHPIFETYIKKEIKKAGLDSSIKVIKGNSYSVFSICDVVLAASGTATLEAALFKKPVIICYKLPGLTVWLTKNILKKDLVVGLPNIILGKKVFPELLQKNFNAENIIKSVLSFIDCDESKKRELKSYYDEIEAKMGEYPVINRIAAYILGALDNG